MPISTYIAIIRRHWPLVVAPAVIAGVISLGLALLEPPRYRSSASLLITRSEDRRFDTEDALAYDLPAIVQGAPFSAEVSSALALTGVSLPPDQVRASLGASNQRRVVQIWAETGDPGLSEALTTTAVALIQRRGLALWGDPAATPDRPLVNVVVLEPPGPATRTNGWTAAAVTALLRGLAGLLAGALLAFGAHYRATARTLPLREGGG
ncbi:MAG: lipopolysaccharide biosynthesis protein [Roseiflexus sp.]|nr:lipopolysaccharide biosynthesis protein [Roseiflexus sp.]MDW8147183.1 lipopolysaccharide biosynthesis protein [Roseiflexaceae bacterium]MDW8231583.1 lipopolysaccharide biosynthesis protein [Roseiflexaceae bacterium]